MPYHPGRHGVSKQYRVSQRPARRQSRQHAASVAVTSANGINDRCRKCRYATGSLRAEIPRTVFIVAYHHRCGKTLHPLCAKTFYILA